MSVGQNDELTEILEKQSEMEWSMSSPVLIVATFGNLFRFIVILALVNLMRSFNILIEHLLRSSWILILCGSLLMFIAGREMFLISFMSRPFLEVVALLVLRFSLVVLSFRWRSSIFFFSSLYEESCFAIRTLSRLVKDWARDLMSSSTQLTFDLF